MDNKPLVFLNASVILAGLHSPSGGSAKILHWGKTHKIQCIISEIVFKEVLRHANKLGLSPLFISTAIFTFAKISPAPLRLHTRYKDIVKDEGDLHLFTSCASLHIDYLVSLDKKHVLALKEKITEFTIVTPGELISLLS